MSHWNQENRHAQLSNDRNINRDNELRRYDRCTSAVSVKDVVSDSRRWTNRIARSQQPAVLALSVVVVVVNGNT